VGVLHATSIECVRALVYNSPTVYRVARRGRAPCTRSCSPLANRVLLLPCVSPASRREPLMFPVMFSLVVFPFSHMATEEAVASSSVSPMVGGAHLPFAFFFPS